MLDIEKKYTIKILILFLATGLSIFAIWYALMREESVDWLSSKITHQVSPYAITEDETGLIISNVIIGYGFNLPKGFKTAGAKNLNFFMGEAEAKKCEIKHYYLSSNKANGLEINEARLIIPLRQQKVVFELVDMSESSSCGKYLDSIENSFLAN